MVTLSKSIVRQSTHRQTPRSDVAIRLPWSKRPAIAMLDPLQFRRLARAYEQARELGPKTIMIRDAQDLLWIVHVAKSAYGYDVTWRFVC
ncbi:hypothetical protein NA78x_001801 [Anatilimnocola sp. NA78]|uniref:hypothetical protein n=1 Tax=Anatilimnocola sp. NA78 TaxID=3415683 RepID=UPI003CE530EF